MQEAYISLESAIHHFLKNETINLPYFALLTVLASCKSNLCEVLLHQ